MGRGDNKLKKRRRNKATKQKNIRKAINKDIREKAIIEDIRLAQKGEWKFFFEQFELILEEYPHYLKNFFRIVGWMVLE